MQCKSFPDLMAARGRLQRFTVGRRGTGIL